MEKEASGRVGGTIALVLHGKIGAFARPGASSGRAVDNAEPNLDMLALAYSTVVRHILTANANVVDIIGHSWSPSVGAAVDALFQVRASSHQPEETKRNRQVCEELAKPLMGRKAAAAKSWPESVPFSFANVGHGTSSCERTASQLLSMRRAILLKAQLEDRRGQRYAGVLISRWDMAWASPVSLAKFHLADNTFVMPQGCVPTPNLDGANQDAWRARVCGRDRHTPARRDEPAAALMLDDRTRRDDDRKTQLSTRGLSSRAALQHELPNDLRPAAYGVWLSDLWLAAGSAEADAFGQAGSARTFANLTAMHATQLTPAGTRTHMIYGHTLWGLHLHHGLRARLSFAPMHLGCVQRILTRAPLHTLSLKGRKFESRVRSVDFAIARYWWREHCRALTPSCAGKQCAARDVRPRHWHTDLGEAPSRTPSDVVPGAEHMASSCSEGYFYCARGSRMCAEERVRAGNGLDTHEARAVFYLCSERVCAAKGVSPTSPECAGWLLALAVEVGGAADRAGGHNRSAAIAPTLHKGSGGPNDATARLSAHADTLLSGADRLSRASLREVCPDIELLPKLMRAPIGYCDGTDDNEGDCERGNSGSFRIGGPAAAVHDHTSCIERCRGCARCNFVSISPTNHDCSWFHKCKVPVGLAYRGNSYVTFAVPKAKRA